MVDTKFFIGIAVGLISLFSLALILQTVNAKDVQIIENRIGGSGGCTDLDCLDDVEIISPDTGQFLLYNFTGNDTWINTHLDNQFTRVCQNFSIGTSITCDLEYNFDRYLFIIDGEIRNNTFRPGLRFNSDSGTNYSYQSSIDLGAYGTNTNQTSCLLIHTNNFATNDRFIIYGWIIDHDDARKAIVGKGVYGLNTDDLTLQKSIDYTCKWDNTTDTISSITILRISGIGSFESPTGLTVWGYS